MSEVLTQLKKKGGGNKSISLLGSVNFTISAPTTLTINLSKEPEDYVVAFYPIGARTGGFSNVESRSVSISGTTLTGTTLTVNISSENWASHAVYVTGTCVVYGY